MYTNEVFRLFSNYCTDLIPVACIMFIEIEACFMYFKWQVIGNKWFHDLPSLESEWYDYPANRCTRRLIQRSKQSRRLIWTMPTTSLWRAIRMRSSYWNGCSTVIKSSRCMTGKSNRSETPGMPNVVSSNKVLKHPVFMCLRHSICEQGKILDWFYSSHTKCWSFRTLCLCYVVI